LTAGLRGNFPHQSTTSGTHLSEPRSISLQVPLDEVHKPLHGPRRFDHHTNRPRQFGIKLPYLVAFVLAEMKLEYLVKALNNSGELIRLAERHRPNGCWKWHRRDATP